MAFESFPKALVEEETDMRERKIMKIDNYKTIPGLLFPNWEDYHFPVWAVIYFPIGNILTAPPLHVDP